MTTSPWAWIALLGGVIVVTGIALCYSKEERPASDPFAGVPTPRRALVMQ